MVAGALHKVVVIQQPLWFVQTCYGVCIAVVVLTAIFAIAYAVGVKKLKQSLSYFIAAPKSSGLLVIPWALSGSILAAGACLNKAQQIGYIGQGIMGIGADGLYGSIPVVVACLLGIVIRKRAPNILSFTDFLRKRFGLLTFLLSFIIITINMAVQLLSEFVSIYDLFEGYVDPHHLISDHPGLMMVLLIAFLAAIYTAVGGLYISLVTDVIQGIVSLVLLVFLVIYMAVYFRFPKGFNPRKEFYANNVHGRTYIGKSAWAASLPVLVFNFYSEAVWQRVWAAKNFNTLLQGSIFAFFIILFETIIIELMGAFYLWTTLDNIDPQGNLTLMTVFQGRYASWCAVIVVIVLIIKGQTATDSFQNGILSSIATAFIQGRHSWILHRMKKADKRAFNSNESWRDFIKNGKSNQNAKNGIKTGNGRNGANFDEPSPANSEDLKSGGNKHNFNLDMIDQNIEPGQIDTGIYDDVGFRKTLWIRLVVLILIAVLVPIAVKVKVSLVNAHNVIKIITSFIIVPQIIGVLVAPKYFSEWQQLVVCAACATSCHIYAIILQKCGGGVTKLPYSSKNVFRYVWTGTLNKGDFGIFVTMYATGIILTGLFVLANSMYQMHHVQKGLSIKGMFQQMYHYQV